MKRNFSLGNGFILTKSKDFGIHLYHKCPACRYKLRLIYAYFTNYCYYCKKSPPKNLKTIVKLLQLKESL